MSVTTAPRPTPASWPWLAGTAAALALWALLYSLLIPFSEAVTARLPVQPRSRGEAGEAAQTVSIADGAFDGSVVDGNLYLAGGACNGGNGFYGVMSPPTPGTASSYWGTVTFAKQ